MRENVTEYHWRYPIRRILPDPDAGSHFRKSGLSPFVWDLLCFLFRTSVNHGGDLGYLFDTMFSKISTMDPHDENSKMSSKYLKLLTNFAKSGNPTPEVDELLGVTWNPVATNKANYLNIDKVLTMEDDFMKENMEFWSSVSTPWD